MCWRNTSWAAPSPNPSAPSPEEAAGADPEVVEPTGTTPGIDPTPTTAQAPDDPAVVPVGDGHWDWLKWLPHHRDHEVVDAAGPRRLTFPDLDAARGSVRAAQLDAAEKDAVSHRGRALALLVPALRALIS